MLQQGSHLLALPVEVDEDVAGSGDVMGCHPLIHAVDVEVETSIGVHQQPQHSALGAGVQVRSIVLTDLGSTRRR